VPTILPVRQGYRDQHKATACLGGFIVIAMLSLLWFAPPQYDSTVVAALLGVTGFVLIFPGFVLWISLWYLRILRDGKWILGEGDRLTYAWRTGSKDLNLVEVHTIRWWWVNVRWGEPIRLWTTRKSIGIDPDSFTVQDRERLVAWLRDHLPPQVVQLGQDEFAQMWANMRRTSIDWPKMFRWMFGWRFLVLLVAPTFLAAAFGAICWAYLQLNYPELGPVDVSGPYDGPFGRILLGTVVDWSLFLALPAVMMVGAVLGLLRGAIWLDRYTNRDAFGPSSTHQEEQPCEQRQECVPHTPSCPDDGADVPMRNELSTYW
jgi:hypothetical protein